MAAESKKNTDIDRLIKGLFSDDWMVKTGVGGVLSAGALVAILYSLYCLPIFAGFSALAIGYCLRCMRVKAADPEAKLPQWNDWVDLFLSGITWIALQTGIWLSGCCLLAVLLLACLNVAFMEKSSTLSLVWTLSGCTFVFMALALMSLLSAYVMVNFALEENARAGLAYGKVARCLVRSPGRLACGFLLATGIQYLAVIVPCLTVVGIFLVPSSCFAGSIVSSIVLARHWCVCTESKAAADTSCK